MIKAATEIIQELKEGDTNLNEGYFEIMELFLKELKGLNREKLKVALAGAFIELDTEQQGTVIKMVNILKEKYNDDQD